MRKKYFIVIILLLVGNLLFASAKDTLPGNTDIMVFRYLESGLSWLSFDVDFSWKINSPSFEKETRHFQFHNDQYCIQTPLQKKIQNYSFRYSVDTNLKVISVEPRRNFSGSLMFFDFENQQIRERHILRTYTVDTGSLRKLVVEFKDESPWAKYSVVYDPLDFLPKQIRYSMKQVNSSGQRADHEYICDFKNYQTIAFDESVFSNEPYFRRVDGTLVLTEEYHNYRLNISGQSK